MKKIIIPFFLLILLLTNSCKKNNPIDLMNLNLNEKITDVVDFNDSKSIGVETLEYPFCLFLEVRKSNKYTFDDIELENQEIFFQIDSQILKTDSITKQGGGHMQLESFKNETQLTSILNKYKAKNTIYGYRIVMSTTDLKNKILKKLENKYGKGIKNTNTDNGIYWNVKDENKFIFFAPDYDRLVVLNNTNLSKTCYWDSNNGLVDFGNCNQETYFKELIVSSDKKRNPATKMEIVIDTAWNFNNFKLTKTNEVTFTKSSINKEFERSIYSESSSELNTTTEVIYQNTDTSLFFYFTYNENNQESNILKGYSVLDFNNVKITFENGLKTSFSKDEVIKLFKKEQIKNFNDLKFSNYIEISHQLYEIKLVFGDKDLFKSFYVMKKP